MLRSILVLVPALALLAGCGKAAEEPIAPDPGVYASSPSASADPDDDEIVITGPEPSEDSADGGGSAGGGSNDGGSNGAGQFEMDPNPTYSPSGQDLAGFTSPSGNIACLFDGTSEPASVRCDVAQHSWRAPAKPADCQWDWGNALGLSVGGRAQFICVGDTVLGVQGETDGSRVLRYGETFHYRGLQCRSSQAGVSCYDGTHGFAVRRADYLLV